MAYAGVLCGGVVSAVRLLCGIHTTLAASNILVIGFMHEVC